VLGVLSECVYGNPALGPPQALAGFPFGDRLRAVWTLSRLYPCTYLKPRLRSGLFLVPAAAISRAPPQTLTVLFGAFPTDMG
jgi:hypothetical protein